MVDWRVHTTILLSQRDIKVTEIEKRATRREILEFVQDANKKTEIDIPVDVVATEISNAPFRVDRTYDNVVSEIAYLDGEEKVSFCRVKVDELPEEMKQEFPYICNHSHALLVKER